MKNCIELLNSVKVAFSFLLFIAYLACFVLFFIFYYTKYIVSVCVRVCVCEL